MNTESKELSLLEWLVVLVILAAIVIVIYQVMPPDLYQVDQRLLNPYQGYQVVPAELENECLLPPCTEEVTSDD